LIVDDEYLIIVLYNISYTNLSLILNNLQKIKRLCLQRFPGGGGGGVVGGGGGGVVVSLQSPSMVPLSTHIIG
jgi:uncharacterized membrane protein